MHESRYSRPSGAPTTTGGRAASKGSKKSPAMKVGKESATSMGKARLAVIKALRELNPGSAGKIEEGGLHMHHGLAMCASPIVAKDSKGVVTTVVHVELASEADILLLSNAEQSGDPSAAVASKLPKAHCAMQALMAATCFKSAILAFVPMKKKAAIVVMVEVRCNEAIMGKLIDDASLAAWVIDAVERVAPTREPAAMNGAWAHSGCRCFTFTWNASITIACFDNACS